MLTDKIQLPMSIRSQRVSDDDQPWVRHLFLSGVRFRRCALAVLWTSLGMYLAAFAVPDDRGTYGFAMFLIGLFWCWCINITYSWWANVIYWAGLVSFCKAQWSRASVCGVFAATLGSAWALQDSRALDSRAFLLWAASMGVLGVGALCLAVWKNRQSPAGAAIE